MDVWLKWLAQVFSDQSKISLYIVWHHNTGDEVNQEITAEAIKNVWASLK